MMVKKIVASITAYNENNIGNVSGVLKKKAKEAYEDEDEKMPNGI